jgi:SAM-dependent methyltransferase
MRGITRARRLTDLALYALIGSRWAALRSQRAWNRHAQQDPRNATAAHDSSDWEAYWRSGHRDFDLVLSMARAAGMEAFECAVEIGCGLGRLTRVAGITFNRVVGLDIAPEMLAIAQRESAAPTITYAPINVSLTMPVAASSADLVFAWTVFRHVSKRIFSHYLDESYRVLRPGAYLAFEAQIREEGRPANPFPTEPYTEREYTRTELATLCEAHGYAWAADRTISSITPGTHNLVVVWRKPSATKDEGRSISAVSAAEG